jgi:phosphopentomutase
LLVYGKNAKQGVDLGTGETFADVGCTLAEVFAVKHRFPGKSFLNRIE